VASAPDASPIIEKSDNKKKKNLKDLLATAQDSDDGI
jgi:hypothetical protein